MKYLFCVHSPITYLSALGVVLKESIPLEDVVFVSNGLFVRETPIKCHVIELCEKKDVLRHPIKSLFHVAYADRQLEKILRGEKFVAYISVMFRLARIIVTNKNCVSFNFIEEGSSAYSEQFRLDLVCSNRKPQESFRIKSCRDFITELMLIVRGYTSKMNSLPFFYNSYYRTAGIKFYGFGNSFPGQIDVCHLSLTDIGKSFKWNKKYDLDNSTVFLGSPIVRVVPYPLEDYLKGIEQGCIRQLISKGIKKVFAKFHPAELNDTKNGTIRLFQQYGIEYEVIPNEVIFEIEMMNTQNLHLWGVDCSIFIYAKMLGISCHSFINYLPNYSKMKSTTLWENVDVVK